MDFAEDFYGHFSGSGAYIIADHGQRGTEVMYYDRFFPFYVAYANPALYDGERIQEREF